MSRKRKYNRQIDLHNKTADEAIDYFVCQSNAFLINGFKGHLVVVHGYGSSGQGNGVIKDRIRDLVSRWPDYFEILRCDDWMPGETRVRPVKPFPYRRAGTRTTQQQVYDFCKQKRMEADIYRKFSKKHSYEIRQALCDLEAKGLLEPVVKAGEIQWRLPVPILVH